MKFHRQAAAAAALVIAVASCSGSESDGVAAQDSVATTVEASTSTSSTSTTAPPVTTSSTTTSSSTTTTIVQTETPREFAKLWTESIRSSQQGFIFLRQRIHPGILDVFGQACADAVTERWAPDPAYLMQVNEVRSGPEPWAIDYANHSFDFEDVYTAEIRITQTGGSTTQDMHLGLVNDRLYWFPFDCYDLEPVDLAADDELPAAGTLIVVGGETTSEPFTAPASWRVEVEATDLCLVEVLRDADGSTADIKSSDGDFVIQIREAGRFYIETSGCLGALAIEN